ncbi:hypothetical protein RvY_17047-2 [Ramazzottius varieornatus]|uniref:Uncharacterized protein n=1 Tax=Ramazzottius varieornatus TaxID=947166 RepID=A0A1D1W352_RAMVA|nr:hypothetical protein RvY_17047-2 [Ramazzottius varieornatus]
MVRCGLLPGWRYQRPLCPYGRPSTQPLRPSLWYLLQPGSGWHFRCALRPSRQLQQRDGRCPAGLFPGQDPLYLHADIRLLLGGSLLLQADERPIDHHHHHRLSSAAHLPRLGQPLSWTWTPRKPGCSTGLRSCYRALQRQCPRSCQFLHFYEHAHPLTPAPFRRENPSSSYILTWTLMPIFP